MFSGISKSMGRFQIQILLQDAQWHSKRINDKTTNYCATSEEWDIQNLDFRESNFCRKSSLWSDRQLADMCFINIKTKYSVF